MSDEKALVPMAEKQVDFYGDELTAALVDVDGRQEVLIPLRPICDFLGIDWSGQRQRILRDRVLSAVLTEVVMSVGVTPTDIGASSRRPRSSVMLCLPLEYLNGWLFGINAARVRPELQQRVERYQRDCYKVLAAFFMERERPLPADSPSVASLNQIREMALAIAEMAAQQIEYEGRIATTESRLDRAAVVVGQIQNRLTAVERKLAPGNPITDEQAAEIQAAVHALTLLLTEQDKGKNHFQGIFNELHRRFGVTSYKLIPQGKYADVLEFLGQWRENSRSE
jgi:hypothetical protein